MVAASQPNSERMGKMATDIFTRSMLLHSNKVGYVRKGLLVPFIPQPFFLLFWESYDRLAICVAKFNHLSECRVIVDSVIPLLALLTTV